MTSEPVPPNRPGMAGPQPGRRKTIAERFWPKVQRGTVAECWPWRGAIAGGMGYGVIQRGGRGGGLITAHNVSWELTNGPVPDGLILDHLCRTPSCVNPAHLEPVTNRENILRGESMAARYARRTHCAKGHELGPEDRGHRCRECRRIWDRAYYRRRKAAAK